MAIRLSLPIIHKLIPEIVYFLPSDSEIGINLGKNYRLPTVVLLVANILNSNVKIISQNTEIYLHGI